MKRLVVVCFLLSLCGCSNAPVAGFLDACFPSKPGGLPPDRSPPPLGDRIPPPADLGGPVGPPAPGN